VSANITEEEQIEAFKRWWKANGKLAVTAVVLASAGYFGYGAYQSAQEKTAQTNSSLYDKLVAAVTTNGSAPLNADQLEQVKSAADAILAVDGESLYADLAHFHLAKAAVDAGNYDDAQSELSAVVENSKTESSKELARLRLARVEAAKGNTEAALALLETPSSEAFAAAYAEAKGDILVSVGRLDEAFSAFEAAISALEEKESNEGLRANILSFKLNNTRVATALPQTGPNDAPSVGNNPHGTNLGKMTNPHMVNPHISTPDMPNPHTVNEDIPTEGAE
jgi:predicted negative regulator of RcsB-dependent stress response